jgi:hypothetical protein
MSLSFNEHQSTIRALARYRFHLMLGIVRAVSCHGAGVLIDIDLPA